MSSSDLAQEEKVTSGQWAKEESICGGQGSQQDIWNYSVEAKILYPCCNSILLKKQ